MQPSLVLHLSLTILSSSFFVAATSSPNSFDECGSVNVPLTFNKQNFGTVNQCLCKSQIPSFVDSNKNCQKASSYAGRDAVINLLNSGCTGAPNHKQCNYPPNSIPQCTSSNPCGFTCSNGYTPWPTTFPSQCVCDWPKKVCNGQCGSLTSCHSSLRKRDDEWYKKTGCKEGWTACGVFGGSRRAWECVNTKFDLESCGGCMYPLHAESPTGTDCSDIQGVADVSCSRGSCDVQRCRPGWSVSPDGTSCLPSNGTRVYGFDDLRSQN